MGVRTLPSRLGTSLMTLFGIAGVVAAFLVVLSIAAGLESVLSTSGADDTVVVMRVGSNNEMASSLGLDATRAISEAPGLARGSDGPIMSAEIVVVVDVPKRTTGTDAQIPLRGVQLSAPSLREGFEIVQGRMFDQGKYELIVGRGALGQYDGLDLGSSKQWGDTLWTVVGVFAAAGSVAESEIWTDLHMLQPVYGFGSDVHTVHARLDGAEDFDELRSALEDDVRTNVIVQRDSEFYGSQSETLTSTLRFIGGIAGLLMGVCAAFGALNTMYAAVSARTREIATLRAIGFGAVPCLVSVLSESLAVAAVGGALGAIIAFVGFDGLATSTMNWATYTQLAFTFEVTPTLALQGIGYALAIGLVGGLFPALRVARLPVAVALREA